MPEEKEAEVTSVETGKGAEKPRSVEALPDTAPVEPEAVLSETEAVIGGIKEKALDARTTARELDADPASVDKAVESAEEDLKKLAAEVSSAQLMATEDKNKVVNAVLSKWTTNTEDLMQLMSLNEELKLPPTDDEDLKLRAAKEARRIELFEKNVNEDLVKVLGEEGSKAALSRPKEFGALAYRVLAEASEKRHAGVSGAKELLLQRMKNETGDALAKSQETMRKMDEQLAFLESAGLKNVAQSEATTKKEVIKDSAANEAYDYKAPVLVASAPKKPAASPIDFLTNIEDKRSIPVGGVADIAQLREQIRLGDSEPIAAVSSGAVKGTEFTAAPIPIPTEGFKGMNEIPVKEVITLKPIGAEVKPVASVAPSEDPAVYMTNAQKFQMEQASKNPDLQAEIDDRGDYLARKIEGMANQPLEDNRTNAQKFQDEKKNTITDFDPNQPLEDVLRDGSKRFDAFKSEVARINAGEGAMAPTAEAAAPLLSNRLWQEAIEEKDEKVAAMKFQAWKDQVAREAIEVTPVATKATEAAPAVGAAEGMPAATTEAPDGDEAKASVTETDAAKPAEEAPDATPTADVPATGEATPPGTPAPAPAGPIPVGPTPGVESPAAGRAREAQEAAEREARFGELRGTYVDSEDALRAWFSGKEKGSPHRGVGALVRGLYNAAAKAGKESTASTMARTLVEKAAENMFKPGSDPQDADAAIAAAITELGKSDAHYLEFQDTSDMTGLDRIKAAVKAKADYGSAKQKKAFAIMGTHENPDKLARDRVLAVKAAVDGNNLDNFSPTERQQILKEYNRLQEGKLAGQGELYEQLVKGEYEAQLAHRMEKLGDKKAGMIRKSWDWYKSKGAVTKFGISVLGGGSIVLLGSMAVGGAAAGSIAGATGYLGYRAIRAFGTMVGSRIGAKAGVVAESIYGKFADKNRPVVEQIQSDINTKEWQGKTPAERKLEAFSFLSKAYDDYAKVEATNQRLARRRNIAAVLGGVAGGLGTAGVMHMTDGYMKELIGIGQPEPTPGATAGKEGGAPDSTDATKAAPTGNEKAPSAETGPTGYIIGKGQGIWHAVKDQMRARVLDGSATATDLSMNEADFNSFKADLLDDKSLSPENAKLLDRSIARTLTAKNMMNMGIKSPGEVVTWKPGANGGDITFSSGNAATYAMNGSRPVAIENMQQTNASTLSPAEQIQHIKDSIRQATGGGVETAVTENVETSTADDWTYGLTAEQIALAQPKIAQMEAALGFKLDNPQLIGRVNLKEFFDQVPANVSLDPNVPVRITINGMTFDVPMALRQLRASGVAIDPEDLKHDDIETWLKKQVALDKLSIKPKVAAAIPVTSPTPVITTQQVTETVQPVVTQPTPVSTPTTTQQPPVVTEPQVNPQNPMNRPGLPGYKSPMPNSYNVPADPMREPRYTYGQAPQFPREVQEQILQRDQQTPGTNPVPTPIPPRP